MDLTEDQERILREAAAANEQRNKAVRRTDRGAWMADVIKEQRKRGFKGDAKVRWTLRRC